MAAEDSQSISLKVQVVNEKNRVIFAEPNKDFVDVLFSFMTMPLGIIISLTREHPPKESFGCFNNLYESVENHEEKHLQSVKCKEMLLHFQSSVELSCKNLKLNLVNSNSNGYYVCDNPECPLSAYKIARCRCGSTMNNFQVMPMSTMTGLALLNELQTIYGHTLLERTIEMGRVERRRSLYKKPGPRRPILNSTKMTLKLIVNKSNKWVLYAEANEDFEMKAILVDPKLAPGLAWNKQLIPIEEASYPSLSCATSLFTAKRVQSSSGKTILANDS
ncbi:uncharacterized protein LOC132295911 [Cornus florida]|uniref:uncharacterized protein LOC132295911 n=1 Tax=Cornus florida TaxID=4283 RepID=UPI00289777C8|nr:uncharacterized protein LOC132295911 [Cornus florida]